MARTEQARRKENPAHSQVHSQAIPVLVLGDWVVDENWVLADHQSPLSSLEGRAHLRALGKLESRLMTFCGAGRVARFLYWLNRFADKQPDRDRILGDGSPLVSWRSPEEREHPEERERSFWFNIVGLGVWASQDEAKLYKMFHPSYPEGINSFTLAKNAKLPAPYEELDGLILNSLAGACPDGEEIGTTRIYRLYQHRAEALGGLELDRRIDFELRFSDPAATVRAYNAQKLAQLLQEVKNRISSQPSPTSTLRNDLESLARHLSSALEAARRLPSDTRSIELQRLLQKAETLIPAQQVSLPVNILPEGRPFRYAIIKELGKGAVTKDLLKGLATAGLVNRETVWFISSKLIQPSWLVNWDRSWGKVYLWFLAPKAVAPQLLQDTESDNVKSLPPFPNKWFIGSRYPANEAIHGLNELMNTFFSKQKEAFVVAMPRGLSLLGVEQNGGNRCGYYYPDPSLSKLQAELTGRASIFFAALAAKVIHHMETEQAAPHSGRRIDGNKSSTKPSLLEPLQLALAAAQHYVDVEIEHLRRFGEAEQQSSHPLLIGFDSSLEAYRERSSAWKVRHFDWRKAAAQWENAQKGTGVVFRDNAYYLEVWRARYELEDYIETVDNKRKEIDKLIRVIKDFKQELLSPRSISALLIAKPGSGKSYLVDRLAESLEMPPLTFNVTQMVTRGNVVACFDAIASAQAKARGARHLVFFDEINSLLENSHVYDLFLSVLEDGTYLRQGQLFKLDPCAWLFASTEPLKSAHDARGEIDESEALAKYLSSKAPDFHSRLSLKSVQLDTDGQQEECRLGFVYQGAIQLQNKHPDIKLISSEVLCAFYCLPIGTSVRDIKHYADRFRNVQYGEVRKRNMPEDLGTVLSKANRNLVDAWEKQLGRDLDQRLVRIRRHPLDIDEKCGVHDYVPQSGTV